MFPAMRNYNTCYSVITELMKSSDKFGTLLFVAQNVIGPNQKKKI